MDRYVARVQLLKHATGGSVPALDEFGTLFVLAHSLDDAVTQINKCVVATVSTPTKNLRTLRMFTIAPYIEEVHGAFPSLHRNSDLGQELDAALRAAAMVFVRDCFAGSTVTP